jgi:hypothetical protein
MTRGEETPMSSIIIDNQLEAADALAEAVKQYVQQFAFHELQDAERTLILARQEYIEARDFDGEAW